MNHLDSVRNVAIIAHVDHGKTTLVDALLRQSEVFRKNQVVRECVMDSNDLERERGITIFSKNAAVKYKDVKINIIDTPGHADFGGEVERVINMADGVLLLVDAFEGPMPQTRYVLQKALAANLKAIVVINKIDKPDARPETVLDEVFDLFVELEANDEQLDFPVLYASGRDGYAKNELEDESDNCLPVMDAILKHVPPPVSNVDAPLQVHVEAIDYNDYVGRIAIGRVVRGIVKEKQSVALLKTSGKEVNCRIEAINLFQGLGREQVKEAPSGEIVCLTGMADVDIGDTISDPEVREALPVNKVDEPTLTMEFVVNNSPFAGEEGKYVTSNFLRDRLERELRSNVALRVEDNDSRDAFRVSGRGLMHLGILIENMRREGYELGVGKPHVILKEIDGKVHEPIEILTVDVPDDYTGKVMEITGARKASLEKMEKRGTRQHLAFRIPSRGLIGLRGRLLNATKGEAVVYHVFAEYQPYLGDIPGRPVGVMVNTDKGEATAYSIDALQLRGDFFVGPQTRVYGGMIVGEHNRNEDLSVNITKGKKLTNVRAAGSDRNMVLAPPREMSLEVALEYIEDDELVEVTPENIRLRKRILDENERKRMVRNAAKKA